MRFREEVVGAATVLTPHGDLDLRAMPAFEAEVDRLIRGGARLLVWDLSAAGMLPSTAAGFLLQTARRLREAGGRMVLAGARPRALGTLRTMGVADVFKVYPTREAALEALREPPRAG
jgi:anti-sigma B factor antagonist